MKECTEEKKEGRWAEKSNERVEGATEGEIRGREGIRVGVKKKKKMGQRGRKEQKYRKQIKC